MAARVAAMAGLPAGAGWWLSAPVTYKALLASLPYLLGVNMAICEEAGCMSRLSPPGRGQAPAAAGVTAPVPGPHGCHGSGSLHIVQPPIT